MDFSTLFARAGLDPDDFESPYVETTQTEEGFVYRATMREAERKCPRCGSANVVRIGFYTKHVSCTVNRNFTEALIVRVPRMACRNPRCRLTFSPRLHGLRRKAYVPVQTANLIAVDLRREMSAAQIARDYGVSNSYVLGILDDVYGRVERLPLGEEVCVDEFKFHNSNRGKYPLIVVDGTTGRILDVVRSRRADTMYPYFASLPKKERDRVLWFNSDMYDPYRDAARMYFKNATHVIDPFHIVKQFTAALTMERNRFFKRAPDTLENRFQKRHWKLFLMRRADIPKGEYHYVDYDRTRRVWKTLADGVDAVLAADPGLLALHDALLAVFALIDGRNARPSGEELDWIRAKVANSGTEEGGKVAATLAKWSTEIRRTFALRESGEYHSNSPAEGMNNRIATIIKVSYGIVDFDRMRNRVLLVYGMGAEAKRDEERASISREYDGTVNRKARKAE